MVRLGQAHVTAGGPRGPAVAGARIPVTETRSGQPLASRCLRRGNGKERSGKRRSDAVPVLRQPRACAGGCVPQACAGKLRLRRTTSFPVSSHPGSPGRERPLQQGPDHSCCSGCRNIVCTTPALEQCSGGGHPLAPMNHHPFQPPPPPLPVLLPPAHASTTGAPASIESLTPTDRLLGQGLPQGCI